MKRNETYIKKAGELFPKLNETEVRVQGYITPVERDDDFTAEPSENGFLEEGDSLYMDFGDHFTGYLSFFTDTEGAHPDAPVLLRITFAERLSEFFEDASEYQGWVSKAWIQQETIHIDIKDIPGRYTLNRRAAFRYVKVEVLAMSRRFKLLIREAEVLAVSSADDSLLSPCRSEDPLLRDLDRIAIRTLHECMQSVFEDGPKRDRRLWIGDLRLEALANYETYGMNSLVKQGLYLFAADTMENGQVASNIFIEPSIEADDTAMFDYALFFPAILRDYVNATGDRDTLTDLYDTALRQIEIAGESLGSDGLVHDSDVLGWCFLDWNMNLNKQAGAQGVYLYALLAMSELARLCGREEDEKELLSLHEKGAEAAKKLLFSKEKGLFVSGKEKQISYASQCWLILGGAVSSMEEEAKILHTLKNTPEAEGMVTPYMYHHYIDALLKAGLTEEAKTVLKEYWGGMRDAGADTFFELYRPGYPNESPYGGTIVNSYCHAWSCAPAYFIRKYGW